MSSRTSSLQHKTAWLAFLLAAAVSMISACSRGSPAPAGSPAPSLPPPPSATVEVPASPTPFQPSPTPQPLAARVNGAEIPLADFQAELARFQAASGQAPADKAMQQVLDDLIDLTLLAQAAAQKGFVVDETMLAQRIEQLTAQVGGAQALTAWMAANGYVEDSFRKDLARSIAAAWMRDQILAGVPGSAEQVHARQILAYDRDKANEAYARLQAGTDFAVLAYEFDAITGGDLGWFPRGYLTDPRLEEAVFGLEPGKYTAVIETLAGFHILQVVERDPQRVLEPDALQTLQAQALKAWMEAQRGQSDIQILLP